MIFESYLRFHVLQGFLKFFFVNLDKNLIYLKDFFEKSLKKKIILKFSIYRTSQF